MYKPIVMLIILGLIFPVFYAKDAGVFKKKARDPSNSEDSQDFWDFNPHADATGDIIQEVKSGSKKSTMSDLEKILKTMEKTLSKMGATTTAERVLLESPASVTSEEEFVLGGQTSENSQSEEQGEEALPLGSSEGTSSDNSEEKESTSETSTDTTPAETGSETENEEDEVPTTEEESQPEEVSEGETETEPDTETELTTPSVTFAAQNSEFGTATLSASIEYDMAFSTFNQAEGKQTFINAISSLLGVEQSLVSVTNIREGSVIFDFEVTLPAGDQQTQDTSVSTLQAFATRLDDGTQDGSLDVFNGASVLDFTRKVTVFGPTSEVNNTVSPKNDTLIAVLIIISAVVILGLVGFFVYKNKQVEAQTKAAEKEPKYKMSAKSEAERLDLESRGTATGSRSSIGEVIGDKLKLFDNSPPSDLTP